MADTHGRAKPSSLQRAKMAAQALHATGGDGNAEQLEWMLADLRHWAAVHGIDYAEADKSAAAIFAEEICGDNQHGAGGLNAVEDVSMIEQTMNAVADYATAKTRRQEAARIFGFLSGLVYDSDVEVLSNGRMRLSVTWTPNYSLGGNSTADAIPNDAVIRVAKAMQEVSQTAIADWQKLMLINLDNDIEVARRAAKDLLAEISGPRPKKAGDDHGE